jgi:hypothetical protein
MPPEELRGAIAARTAEFEAMTRQVNELQAARPSMVAAAVAAARQELIPIDARMRDLAPAISAATRQAEGILSAAAAGRRVEMGPPRFGIPRSISPADVVDRLRQLYRDGFAPGVPQAEIDAVRSALAEREAHPPTLPKIEEKPPEGWAAPETAGEAPGTFRTTVDINGERTVIEGPTRALAKAAAGPEVVTGKQFRQRVAAVGGDLGKASDALVARVEAALGEGRSVTLYAEGKPIKIVSVDRGMMADAEGHRWGTMLLATGDPVGRTRIEIGRKPSAEAAGGREPAAGKTSAEGGKVPAGAPARAAEAIEADPEIAAAEQRFAATQADHPLLPEEQAPLDESRAAVEKASLTEQALQEAADCLKGTGL